MQGVPGEIRDRRETHAPEREFVVLAADDFDGADEQELAIVASSLPSSGRIVVSSTSMRPDSGVRSGAIIAALSFIERSQAVS